MCIRDSGTSVAEIASLPRSGSSHASRVAKAEVSAQEDYSLACRSKERKFGVRGIADGLRQSPLTTCSDQSKEVSHWGLNPYIAAKASAHSTSVTQTSNGNLKCRNRTLNNQTPSQSSVLEYLPTYLSTQERSLYIVSNAWGLPRAGQMCK